MNRRQFFAYTVFALTGLAIAVGLTTLATSLTSQRIGLQDEPLTAGQELAPARARTQPATREPQRARTTDETTPAPAPTSTVEDDHEGEEFEVDDDSSGHGRGRGRGRGRGGDDDD